MNFVFKTLPPSTNHMYGRSKSRVFLKPAVRAAKDAIGWEARSQYRGEPLTGDLQIVMHIYWPDRRKHDWDNNKAFLDALNGILWHDDGQIADGRVIRRYDKENPRVELSVSQVP